jgi:hypothetical protein
MGDTSPSSSPPTSVLGALEQDWLLLLQDKDHPPKRSVKDCLRRSKTLPCPQVLAVLKEQQQQHGLNRQELKLSYFSVLSSYLGRLKDASTNTNTNTNTKAEESSSLWHISKMATVIRFLQLLFEYRVGPEEDENADPLHAPNSTTKTITSSTKATVGAGDAEMNKMILQLIQSLSAVVCACLEAPATAATDEEDVYASDASQSFDARKVACFVFGSLVRINHYVRFRPSLLSPLWKGLCDMASAMKELPSELLNEAVKALLDYLREGTEPTLKLCADVMADYRTKSLSASRSSGSLIQINNNQQLFQAKVLGFLVARATSLLKLPLASETAGSVALAQVFQVLALLRGLAATVEATAWLDEQPQLPNRGAGEDELAAFLKPYTQIATKIERAVCGLVWNRDEDDAETLFDDITLNMLCSVKPFLSWSSINSTSTSTSNVSSISYAAIALGKALLLLKILEETLEKKNSSSRTFSQADVEAIVRICEDLLFQTLPSCYGSLVSTSPVAVNILSRSIRLISESLLCCEVACPCIATNADPGRHRFHRLLVKWLIVSPSPTQKGSEHPLTRELVTTIIYLHTVGLCESDNGGHLEAEPLLLLLVKLFCDARTNTGLRANIGSVVSRILGSSMRCVSKRLEHILVEEFALLDKTMTVEDNKRSKKRKRTSTKRIDIKDLNIICSVMSIFPSGRLPNCQDLLKLDPPANKLSIEAAIVRAAQSTGNAECKLGDFIECFSRLWNDESHRRTNPRYMERLTLFGTMVLRLAYASCDASEREQADGKVHSVCRLIALCTEDRLLHSVTKQRFSLTPVVFEAVRLLGVVGKVLLPRSSQSVLQDLAAVFHRLLSCTSWSIRSFAMSSLVRFASTLPSIHKTILPKCVPTDMQDLLQCRLQSSICGQSESLDTTRAAHTKALSRPLSTRCSEGSIFPTSGSLTIAQGSYCMTMPTQDGRKAIVIFPPGQDSLEDISFMLGMDEDDDKRPTVQTLHKTVVSEDGTCKLLLRS